MRLTTNCVLAIAALGLTGLAGAAAETRAADEAASAPQTIATATPALPPPLDRTLSFASLSGSESEQLRGTEGRYSWRFGIRLDETVIGAELVLRYTASPALLPQLSHLRVRLNGEVVAALPLPGDTTGAGIEQRLSLDPAFFTDYNELTVELIGHYTEDCEFPRHSSLWTTISGRSELHLQLRQHALSRDLSLLPMPFFDPRDGRRVELPIWMPAAPTTDTIEAAGVLASWFGALADYRGARFSIHSGELPAGNAIVLGLPHGLPPDLELSEVQRPTIRLLPNPRDPQHTLLLLQGTDGKQLREAAGALVLGRIALSGDSATVEHFDPGPRRPAYDAPGWAPDDSLVSFGELVGDSGSLEGRGHTPARIEVPLSLPPDLFVWPTRGIPVELRYRYTAPLTADDSILSISIGGKTLKTVRLGPDPPVDAPARLRLHIPEYLLDAGDALGFEFALDHHQSGACLSSGVDLAQVSVDPESTLDLRGFPHYAQLPNLAYFANDGYPFSRYADLAETTIVLSSAPSIADVETALFLLARIGRTTGTAALRFRIAAPGETHKLKDRDLLLVGRGAVPDGWTRKLATQLNNGQRALIGADRWFSMPGFMARRSPWSEGRIELDSDGALGAVLGFESPLSGGRSVVAVLYSVAEARGAVLDALEDPGRVPQIQGDTSFIRASGIESVRSLDRYSIGPLPTRLWLWWYASRHPFLTILLGIVAAALLAWFGYGVFRRIARRRL